MAILESYKHSTPLFGQLPPGKEKGTPGVYSDISKEEGGVCIWGSTGFSL